MARGKKRHVPLRHRLIEGFLWVLIAVGLGIMIFPFVVRLSNAYKSVQMARQYQEIVDTTPDTTLVAELDRATAYNSAHLVNDIVDPFSGNEDASARNEEYATLLDPMGSGVMGYLDIPTINQRLNIYHGTDDKVLENGVGHLQGTSLPVGGEGSHCALSAHRGLPSAKLFTDLDRLKPGDLVLLHVLGNDLAYCVDSSQVVTPDEIDSLAIVPGQDLLTLITCTPYAVNTHRLLVHAHRVPYVPQESMMTKGLAVLTPLRLFLLAALVLGVVLATFVYDQRRVSRSAREPKKPAPTGRHMRR